MVQRLHRSTDNCIFSASFRASCQYWCFWPLKCLKRVQYWGGLYLVVILFTWDRCQYPVWQRNGWQLLMLTSRKKTKLKKQKMYMYDFCTLRHIHWSKVWICCNVKWQALCFISGLQVVMQLVRLLPDGHRMKREVDMALDCVSETMTPMHYHLREIIISTYRQVQQDLLAVC